MGEESRRKKKWDQPDESFIAASMAIPGMFPIANMGSVTINPPTANVIPAPTMPQQAAAVIRKLTQPKPQDDLVIAREIVINEAESAVRYKLTRRQTQEEIQKCSGAVVITRGKYRPPNAMPDGEKPLYLHISAGAHLKETAEKIIAVDRAAAMVEEMMRPTSKAFNTSVYLGFDADPSLNIPARIRGPNDQYINHIMNETGVTVLLRGLGSGNSLEEGEQPLHLFLSSNNLKALEDARLLAENLLDTISRECATSRVPSGKVYAAVPPPQNLLTGVQCSAVPPLACVATSFSAVNPLVSASCTYGAAAQPGVSSLTGQSQPNGVCYPQPSLVNGSSYGGYGGIYPQATPLQQVALALRQTSMSTENTISSTSVSTSAVQDKRPPQKRKFKELPAAPKGTVVSPQAPADLDKTLPGKPGDVTAMPPPKKLAGLPTNGMQATVLKTKDMPPPPPKFTSTSSKSMPPPPPKFNSSPSKSMLPPPPPKFDSPALAHKAGASNPDGNSRKSLPESVPDTLVKLMEYGDDDDDDEADLDNGTTQFSSTTAPKPFWAV